MRKFLRRLRYWLTHRRAAAELAEEIESHRLMRQEQFEQSGYRPRRPWPQASGCWAMLSLPQRRHARCGTGSGSKTPGGILGAAFAIFEDRQDSGLAHP